MPKNKRTSTHRVGKQIAVKQRMLAEPAIARRQVRQIKRYSDYSEMAQYIRDMLRNPVLRRYLVEEPFPTTPQRISHSKLHYGGISLDRQLFWTAYILRQYAEEINTFLKLRDLFSTEMMVGNYDEAASLLDTVQNTLGYSLWLIESRIGLIAEKDGLEKEKEYSNGLLADPNINPIVKFYVNYISMRSEKNISVSFYTTAFENSLQDAETVLADYLRLRMDPRPTSPSVDFSECLNFDSFLPVVDRYLFLVQVFNYKCALTGKITEELSGMKEAVSVLYDVIDDNTLSNVAFYLGLPLRAPGTREEDQMLAILDKYTIGQYEDCLHQCSLLFSTDPCAAELFPIYAKCKAHIGQKIEYDEKPSILNRILEGMTNIVLKNDRATESYSELSKITSIYSGLPWAVYLQGTLIQEYIDDEYDTKYPQKATSVMAGLPTNPLLSLYLPKDFAEPFLSELNQSSTTVQMYRAFMTKDLNALMSLSEVPKYRQLKYHALIERQLGLFSDAKAIYQDLCTSPDTVIRNDAVVGLVRCQIATREWFEAIELVVDTLFSTKGMYVAFPIRTILDGVEAEHPETLVGNISLSILYDFYSRNVSADKDTYKYEAYEDYLFSAGVQRPSQLASIVGSIDRNKLIYFLSNVCTTQTMDNSPEFENMEDVEQERIAVCQLLSTLDAEHKDKYLDEIKVRTQQLVISRGIRHVEESKVYVDTEGIKKSLDKTLRESFHRYISLRYTHDSGLPGYIEVPQVGKTGKNSIMASNEKRNLFDMMTLELRDNFVSSNEYGLDASLSIGFRHGTLSGQIRSRLEAEHLVTQRNHKTGIYRDNEYWSEKYNSLDLSTRQRMMQTLATFSSEVDQLIEMVNKKWIRIKTQDIKSDALFDFTLTIPDLDALESIVGHETTYEKFLDLVFEMLWARTDYCLNVIRYAISIDLKWSFTKVFDNLQKGLDALSEHHTFPELNSKISQVRTIIQYELDRIATWFTRTKSEQVSDFNLNLPVDIALATVLNIHPNKQLTVRRNIDSTLVIYKETLKSFVGIFILLLENIIQHSGHSETTPNVTITIGSKYPDITIDVENDLGPTVELNSLLNRIDGLKTVTQRGQPLSNVSREGGSGFQKIIKIISADMGCHYSMDFGIRDGRNFFVCLVVEGGIVV